jgi:hypothetical protein
LFFKDGATITVPKDECSITCIVDTYVQRSDLHGGTVHVHLPRNSLSKPQWEIKEDTGGFTEVFQGQAKPYFNNTVNLSVINQKTAGLIAHEAVHALQYEVWERRLPGAEIGRLSSFNSNNDYTEDANPYELVAYKFGGEPKKYNDFPAIRAGFIPPIALMDTWHDWWK